MVALIARFIVCLPCPCHAIARVSKCCSFASLGVLSRGFFFLCWCRFWCRGRSFPPGCRVGSGLWLLVLARSFFFPVLLWLCAVGRLLFSWPGRGFWAACLCARGLPGPCVPWLVVGRWVVVVCFCPCRALVLLWGGFGPFLLFCSKSKQVKRNCNN